MDGRARLAIVSAGRREYQASDGRSEDWGGLRMTMEPKTTSLVQAVSDALRERILTGEIGAGQALTEQGIATQADVARPTAKAALERLTHEGLLRRGPNKTARVPRLSSDDIADLYFSRAFLEREVVASLARHKRVPHGAIAALSRFDAALEANSLTGIVQSDIDFHVALVDALGSPRVSRMYAAIIGEAHLCMAQVQAHELLSASTIAVEHRAIVDTIRAGRRGAASSLVQEHLENAQRRLVGCSDHDHV